MDCMGNFIRPGNLCNLKKIQFDTNGTHQLFMAFVLMWVVTLNLNILPGAILMYAVPLSLLEAFIGSYICLKISPNDHNT